MANFRVTLNYRPSYVYSPGKFFEWPCPWFEVFFKYSMLKLRELAHNKSKTSFRIASQFWTNILWQGSNFSFRRNYSMRVDTSTSQSMNCASFFKKTRLPWLHCIHSQTSHPRNPMRNYKRQSAQRNQQNSIHPTYHPQNAAVKNVILKIFKFFTTIPKPNTYLDKA